MNKMHCKRLDEGTDEDFAVLRGVHEQTLRDLPDRLFGLLRDLENDTAYNISRYEHCLQSATRALKDGKDEEYVVVTLLHDICEPLGPFNHGEVVGSILKPFISGTIIGCWRITGCSRRIFTRGISAWTRMRGTSSGTIRLMSRRWSFAPSTTRFRSIRIM
jgi:hypothetical protein